MNSKLRVTCCSKRASSRASCAACPRGDGAVFFPWEERAVGWKCRLSEDSVEAVRNVLQSLHEWAIKQTLEDYQQREPAKPSVKPEAFILTRDTKLVARHAVANHLIKYFTNDVANNDATDLELPRRARYQGFGSRRTWKCILCLYGLVRTTGHIHQSDGCINRR